MLSGGLGSYVTGWEYDEGGREIEVRYPTGEVVRRVYNVRGQVEQEVGYIGQVPWVYLGGAVYNAAGQVEREEWGNGVWTEYVHRADNLRLQRLLVSSGGVVTPLLDLWYEYDMVGNVSELTDEVRGEVETFEYDERDRLREAAGAYGEGHSYSIGGNILTRTVEGEERGYVYGERRPITSSVPGGVEERVYLPLVMGNGPLSYPALPEATTGQPFAVQRLSNGSRYAYDANGNMVLRVVVSDGEVTTYTQGFDAENRLVVITDVVGGIVTRVGYDGEGMRVWQSEGTTTTVYIGGLVEVEIGAGERVTRSYYYVGGQRIGVRVMEGEEEQLYYLHSDHLGSVSVASYGQERPLYLRLYLPLVMRGYDSGDEGRGTASVERNAALPDPFISPLAPSAFESPLPPPPPLPVVEEEVEGGGVLPTTFASPLEPGVGEVVEGSEMRYRPYGEVRTEGEPVGGLTAHTFTGQALDRHTGLMYYGARWYDPVLGRFISADTVVPDLGNPQALNRYSYVYNQPLAYVDREGHFPWRVVIIPAVIVVGVAVGYGVSTAIMPDLHVLPWDPPTMITNRVTDDHPITSNDMTGWLRNQMVTNAQSDVVQAIRENWTSGNLAKQDAAMQAWTALVGTDAVWDFKVDIAGTRWYGDGERNVTLGNRTLNYDAVANIHYGFVGRAAGFETNFLVIAAGIAQARHALQTGEPDDWGACDTTHYCDHPFATWTIQFGAYLYDTYRLDELDDAAFADALEAYIREYGEPPTPPPGALP